jgi:hypothetical protein
MTSLSPQTQHWPEDRAVLFVHGVGNSKPGDYAPLVAQLEAILGSDAKRFAMYFLYYDQYNEWFSAKQQASLAFAKLVQFLRVQTDGTSLGNVAADFGGDVIWPVLLADARLAVRAALLQQLQQIRLDGVAAGFQPRDQHVSIIAHSMGCFHVYEALTWAAANPGEGLGPASANSVFDHVILMASPVELIRTVGRTLGSAIPQRETIATVSQTALAIPAEPDERGKPLACTPHLVSITGNLDPVGGYFFRHAYAWMDLPGQESMIDQQVLATVNGSERITLESLFQSALQNGGPPRITPENPHDWSAYVARHANDLKRWLA